MKYFYGEVKTNNNSIKYLISASVFLSESEIKDYIQEIYLLYLDENIDLNSLDTEDGTIQLAIDIELTKISEDAFNYHASDNSYYCNLHFKTLLFGNGIDELINIYKIETIDKAKALETYWRFSLAGIFEDEEDLIYTIDYANGEKALEKVIADARIELAYQVRRYHPEVDGATLYSSLLCVTQLSQKEYAEEIDKIEECKIL